MPHARPGRRPVRVSFRPVLFAAIALAFAPSAQSQSNFCFSGNSTVIVLEGLAPGFAVFRNESTGFASVDWSVNDITTSAADYSGTGGTLSWSDGESGTKGFSLPILDDGLFDPNERLEIVLTNPVGGSVCASTVSRSKTVWIVDDEQGPEGWASLQTQPPSETTGAYIIAPNAAEGTTVVFEVARVGGTEGPLRGAIETFDLGSTPGSDYQIIGSTTFSWGDGEADTKTFSVEFFTDAFDEGDEEILFLFLYSCIDLAPNCPGTMVPSPPGTPSVNEAQIYIIDTEPSPGTVQFTSTSATLEEGEDVELTLTRTGGSFGSITVDVETSGTAFESLDYILSATQFTWGPGDTSNRTLGFETLEDILPEDPETAVLTLTGSPQIGSPSVATVTIGGSSGTGTLQFTTDTASVVEGSAVEIVLTREDGDQGTVMVDLVTSGSAVEGVDYALSSKQITWDEGDAADKTVTLQALTDALDEQPAETVVLTMSGNPIYLGTPDVVTITLIDPVNITPGPTTTLATGPFECQPRATPFPAKSYNAPPETFTETGNVVAVWCGARSEGRSREAGSSSLYFSYMKAGSAVPIEVPVMGTPSELSIVGGRYDNVLATWRSESGGESTIWSATVDPDTRVVTGPFKVTPPANTTASKPQVVSLDAFAGVFYDMGDRLALQVLDPQTAGPACGNSSGNRLFPGVGCDIEPLETPIATDEGFSFGFNSNTRGTLGIAWRQFENDEYAIFGGSFELERDFGFDLGVSFTFSEPVEVARGPSLGPPAVGISGFGDVAVAYEDCEGEQGEAGTRLSYLRNPGAWNPAAGFLIGATYAALPPATDCGDNEPVLSVNEQGSVGVFNFGIRIGLSFGQTPGEERPVAAEEVDVPLARVFSSDGVPASDPFVVAEVENGLEPDSFDITLTDDNALIATFARNSSSGPVELAANVTRPDMIAPACDPARGLCLQNGRFQVTALWQAPDGSSGRGQPIQLTSDTGYFYFFSPSNVEVVIKVLDACVLNQRFWVFSGGLTTVEVLLRVDDLANGTSRSYSNSQGNAFQPIQDTSAFGTCSEIFSGRSSAPEFSRSSVNPDSIAATAWADVEAIAHRSGRMAGIGTPSSGALVGEVAPEGTCVPSERVACLNNGRFAVEADFVAFGVPGVATQTTLTADTAYFWFFAESNVEIVVKVLDACGFSNSFWVFGGGLTDVEATLRITDTLSGETRVWSNPPSTPFQPIQDFSAFLTCSL